MYMHSFISLTPASFETCERFELTEVLSPPNIGMEDHAAAQTRVIHFIVVDVESGLLRLTAVQHGAARQ